MQTLASDDSRDGIEHGELPAIMSGTSMTTKLCVRTTPTTDTMPTTNPEQQRSGIAHEHRGGKEIVAQKRKADGYQRKADEHEVKLPRIKTRYSSPPATMATKPEASPSSPSIKLVMFTNTTRYNTVKG